MRTGSVLFLLGVCCLARLPGLPGLWFLTLLPVGLLLAQRWRGMRWGVWFLAGFLWALLRADLELLHRLDPSLEGKVLHATGEIASLPSAREDAVRFDFNIVELREPGGRVLPSPGRVRLSWYGAMPELVPGDAWQLTVKLKHPAGFMNPGGFDYEGWLFQQGIHATGYVIEHSARAIPDHANRWNIDRYRHAVRERLNAMLGTEPLGGLIPALAVGDTSTMTRAQWRVLNRSGTTHLLAISGLHIAIFAALCFLFVRRLWPVSATACRLIATPRAAAMAAVLGGIAYSALAGMSVPTQRSMVMIAIWSLAQVSYRHTGMSHVLAVALLAVLLFDPFAVLAPGFWLSFIAVAVIAWGLGNRVGATGWWWRWGQVQVAVTIGLFPVLVAWFQQVPLLGMIANLAAVPWITFLTVPLILSGTAVLPLWTHAGELLLRLALWSLDLLWPLLQMTGESRFSVLTLPPPGVPALVLAMIGAAIILLPKGYPGRWLGLFWMFPLLLPKSVAPESGEFRLALLDVGQGLSAVVRTHEHVLVYDTGPRFGAEFNAGGAVVIPYLRHMGIRTVDILVLSHGDNDHIGGLADVLDGVTVGRMLAGVPEAVPARGVAQCRAGMTWMWDGVSFRILHPPPDWTPDGNNRSCVLRVSVPGRAVLLTGDIEHDAEHALVDHHAVELRSNVLIAPHHGSRTSSSAEFIDAVQPDFVLFPAGYRNRFGFPKQDIIVRYQEHGARVLDTGRSGAIDVLVGGAGVSIRTWRREHRRFWHSQLQ